MLSKLFVEEMKRKLMEAKDRLEAELASLHAHTELGSDIDSNADEVSIDEANQNLIFRMTKDLEKIDIALAKIEEGTYGIDDEGREVSQDRLRVLPWADKAL